VLLRAIGAEPIDHDKTLLCCGKACMTEQIPQQMVMDILESIKDNGADCMGLICPTCFDQFDLAQITLARKFKKSFNVPVVYYFQLLGYAQGLSPREVGLHMHKIKVDRILEMEPA
jgi:heterodisulfide reductase subunit B